MPSTPRSEDSKPRSLSTRERRSPQEIRLAKLRELWALKDSSPRWTDIARLEQLPPPEFVRGDVRSWYLRGGRGSGKTRSTGEVFADLILRNEPGDWGIVAPTYGDARDVNIEGPSGLLRIVAPYIDLESHRPRTGWNRSLGELYLRNGTTIRITGADEGAPHIQGHNLRGCWCSEVGLWRKKWRMAWEESIRYAVRLAPALLICDGTPKAGHPLVKLLMADDSVACTGPLHTIDNAANLAPGAVDEMIKRYGGTRIGRQELYGEILEDVEGTLWTLEQIEGLRILPGDAPGKYQRMVVAVDPSWGTKGDECGIVVAARGFDQRGYVLDDRSMRAAPAQWGAVVKDAYESWGADRIVAEVNFQAEQVKLVMKTVDPKLSFKELHASRGKQQRAEPIAALYEQKKISHIGRFPGLETQMTEWVPGESDFSPDRVDALVWALTELMLTDGGPTTVHDPRSYW